MRTLVILQARQGSSRLPGKSMMRIGGRPMLDYTMESLLRASPARDVYLATSSASENDPLRRLAEHYGVQVVSGDELNVASRYVQILEREPTASYFQRVCGDSPLYDHQVLVRGREIVSVDPGLQVVTSLPNLGYPQGMNLEMVERDTFLQAYRSFSKSSDFEHVTQYLYDRLSSYRHRLISCDVADYAYPRWKFSVDTSREFARMAVLIQSLARPHYTYTLAERCRLFDATIEPSEPGPGSASTCS